jgi:hypothetical protein
MPLDALRVSVPLLLYCRTARIVNQFISEREAEGMKVRLPYGWRVKWFTKRVLQVVAVNRLLRLPRSQSPNS